MRKRVVAIIISMTLIVATAGCIHKPNNNVKPGTSESESESEVMISESESEVESVEASESETAKPTVIRKSTVVVQYPGYGYKCVDTVFNSAKGDGDRYTLSLKDSYADETYNDALWLENNGFPNCRFNTAEGYYITTQHYNIYRSDRNNDNLADKLEIYDNEFNIVASWDFSQFINPNNDGNEYTKESVLWAQESPDGKVLYVNVAHMSYSANQPETGFIMAINLDDGSILWKSKCLVANSYNFVVKGDTIFCGYGFTDEDDYIYALDRRTGKIIDTYSVSTCPDFLYEREGLLFVKCYDSVYVYDIKQ